jgi:hypothetical protein
MAGRRESWRQQRRQQKSLGIQKYIFLKFMNFLFTPKLLATNVANSLKEFPSGSNRKFGFTTCT